MLGLVAWFSFCALIIVVAGTFMARSADRIAEVTGIGRTLVGLVLLAAGTSLPELMVGWTAVRMGSPDLTLGDLLGSSLMNLLILAVLDLFTRSQARMLSSRAAVHALSAGGTIVLKSIVLLAILLGSQSTFLRLGPGAWAIGITYLLCFRLIVLDQQVGRNEAAVAAEAEDTPPGMTLGQAVLVYLACAGAIVFAAPQLAHTADHLTELTGLGKTFFGAVFIAGVTSLPEATATLAALRLGAPDLAIGNILGSNSFNMLILAFIDFADPGALLGSVGPIHAITATAGILVTAVVMLGLLSRAEKRYWLIEPDAVTVILLIVGSLYLVYLKGLA